jgi:DnaK suppressor protein
LSQLRQIYRDVQSRMRQGTEGEVRVADPTDELEWATEDELLATNEQLTNRERELLAKIEDTLRRMHEDPNFGRCIDCGREIPFERLRLVPWTLRCAEDEARVNATRPEPTA